MLFVCFAIQGDIFFHTQSTAIYGKLSSLHEVDLVLNGSIL